MRARRAKVTGASRSVSAATLIRRLINAERRLRQVQQRYEMVMDAIHEDVFDWNIQRDRVEFAGGMERVLGLPPGVLRNSFKEWHERVHPEDFARYREATIAHLKGATERFECEYRYRASGGGWRWARTHGVAIRDRNGRATRMIGATGDITELKRAQDAVRDSEQRYELATSAAVEGIYEWDVGIDNLFLTERAKAVFSLPGGTLTPAAWNTRIHGDDYPGYRAAIVEHFKGRTPNMECEYRIADGQGGYRWVLDRGIGVRDAAGRVTKLVGAISDITERKRAELELRRARDEAQAALERQTAVADVLRVMSESQMDVAPVFDAIMRHAVHLCGAQFGALFRFDGELQHIVALHNFTDEAARVIRGMYPAPPRPDQTSGGAILSRSVQRVESVGASRYPGHLSAVGGWDRILSAPMLRHGKALGAISVAWRHAGGISDRQVALLQTFADQAAIAIGNVRLFNETKEALEQQTATAGILKVTAESRTDVQPVFEAIVTHAARLCEATFAAVFLHDGESLRNVAHRNASPAFARFLQQMRARPSRETTTRRCALERRTIHTADLLNDPEFSPPEAQRRENVRTALSVPMMREGALIGVITLWRAEVRPFTGKQIALVETFADQAIIAIENVRMFNETKEALEQQKALAEVLGAMSGSIADTKPVFDEILENCQRLFKGHLVGLTLAGEDGLIHLGAYKGDNKEQMEQVYPYPLGRDSGSGQAMLDRKVLHFADVDAPGSDAPPLVLRGAQAVGFKSIIFAPLIAEGRAIGALWVGRRFPGPFSGRETALLKTFADQAVIAMQNTRLFREIQDKSRQLETANRHKSEFLANMSHELRTPLNAIIGFTRIVMRRSREKLEPQQYENLEKILASGQNLLALINAILDLSKIEAGRVDLRPAETPLGPVLEQCLRTVEPLSKVPLVKEFDGGLPAMYVDEEKLRQIVLNLLGNAAKFTERGAIRLKAQAANGAVAVVVADTGIGIPADKLGLIFEEFEQVDASSTRTHGGTGLGLAIARRLARLMGGDIRVESVPGSGSTFTLTLPLRCPA